MRRVVVLGTVMGIAAVSMVAFGQAPTGPTARAIEVTKIEKVKDNLYIITGAGAADQTAFSGGNTAVFITDAGVTLVDTKLPGYGPMLLERIKTVTNKPVTRIINTHAHSDHTGGNAFFGPTVESIVHENAKKNLAADPSYAGAQAKFLPTRTYKDKLTVGTGKDQIDIYHFGRGHTDGDSFIVFPALRTMHVGDMFAWKAIPYIDASAGGSVIEHPKSLARAVATVKNVDTIINGHIPVSTWNDLKEYAEFTKDFVAYAEGAMKAGKSVDQAATEYTLAPKYKGYVVTVFEGLVTPKSNLQMAYDELKKK